MRRPLTRAAFAVLLLSPAISGCKHAPSNLPAARRCAELDAANQKALGALTSKNAGAGEELRRTLRDATVCAETPAGAWAILFSSVASDAGQASARWSLVHVDGVTARASVFPDTAVALGGAGPEAAAAAGPNYFWSPEKRVVPRAPVLFDYDGDGQPEAVVIVETVETLESGRSFRTQRGRVWSARTGTIALYAPARDFTVEEVRDADGDGRPDLLTHGPFAELTTIKCGSEEPYPVYGPALLAHARADGTFSLVDAQAVVFAKRECAAAPTSVFVRDRDRPDFVDFPRSAGNLACARLWDADANRIAIEIATHCHQQGSCPTCDDPAMLSRWAKVPPPLRLSAPRGP